MSLIEVKLELNKSLINYNGKPIKDTKNLEETAKNNPTLTQQQIVSKCPDLTIGKILPVMLLQIQSKDPVEKLKLFRLASKIEDKLITDKSELTLDITQINELYEFVGKVDGFSISVIASILIILEGLKEKLNKINI